MEKGGENTLPIYKKPLLVLLILLAAAGGSMIYGWYGQSAEVVDSASGQETDGRAGHVLTVYVTGAVNKPGVVCVEEGARAADAVNACGGLLPIADRDRINLARPLKDGEQLRIPEKQAGAAGNPDGAAGQAKPDHGMININTAGEKELDSLPGIGPAMAKRIIEYREKEGGFQSLEDLRKVKGIGEAKFNKLKDKICL